VPVYHFNWDLGSQRVRDEVGVELTDDDTAPACRRGVLGRSPLRGNAILPLLPHGKARIGKVARGLGRQFSDIVSAARGEGRYLCPMRADLAEGYLNDRSLSITHIAWLLGFQEASAFTHAYKRWTGKPPTDRRRSGARRPPTEIRAASAAE
jgi:AraC-like DNA-binding protein